MEKSSLTKSRRSKLRDLEKRLTYSFRDLRILEMALTHRSFANENTQLAIADNERLEFLGDAVLGLCISDLLIK